MRMLSVLVVVAGLFLGTLGCASCAECQNCRNCGRCDARRANLEMTAPPIDGKTAATASSSGIRVESARYGRDEVWEDVTPQVRRLVNGDTIVFPRDLQATFNVDPIPGRMKYVEMVIIVDGRVMEMTVGDSLHVTPLRLRAGSGGGSGGGGGNGGATTRGATSEQ